MRQLYFLLLTCCSITVGQSFSQDIVLDAYSGQREISATGSVTLKSGFQVASGQDLRIFISSIAHQPLNSAPSANQNYIITNIFRKPYTTVPTAPTTADIIQQIVYFDGLGRKVQSVSTKGSPTMKDIVEHIEYDGFGRQSVKYLPYAEQSGNNGSFKAGAKTSQSDYYKVGGGWDAAIVRTPYPYSVTVFENSPMSRVLEQGAPGAAWQPLPTAGTGHTVKTSYGTNTTAGLDAVRLWTVTTSGATGTTNYLVGKLYRTTLRDENTVNTTARSGSVDEYKDFEGRVVLKRVWESETKALNTYYVYDDFGELRYVIPPAVTATGFSELPADPTFANFDNYIYSYKYDGRRRLIEKKVPGKGWEYLVYNKNDQVVLTQDANQRVRKEWTYIRYDAFGRITSTGLYTNTVKLTRADVSALVDAGTGPLWETRSGADYPVPSTTFPITGTGITIMPRIVNYYDDYAFTGAITLPVSGITRSVKTKSLQTGTKVYRTDATQPLLTVMYYDDYGRVIQTASQNHLEGKDYVTNTYNFPGELLTSTRVHTPKTGAATTIVTTNEYDHMGRLIVEKEKIGAQAEVTLTSKSYNEIGQLKSTAVGKSGLETTFVNTTTYTYNERGWLTKSSSPRFSQQLKYQDGTNPQWNGNISQQLWGDDATMPNTFSYQYDKVNRLLSGVSTPTGAASMSEVITYDDLGMGNIKTLKRDAQPVTTYTYIGNKLTSLTGGLTGNYIYDANGNAITDRMGIDFTYNYLNLPQTATKTGTNVSFLYDATGRKLQKVSKIGTTSVVTTTRDYVGGIEYNNGAIDIIHNSAGYALKSGANYVYHYNLSDHLGNVRATLKRGSSATAVDVIQRDNYYPFGKRKVVAGGNNKYLYNGKEIQGELGDSYDYGARLYDAEIGRWNVIDPHGERYASWSPYNYTFNDPINTIDPDGRDGMLTGTGTKEDPYVITAKYYYVTGSLNKSEVKALDGAIKDYNKLGGKDGVEIKNEDGTVSYIKYNLSSEGVADLDAAKEAAYSNKFTDQNDKERYYGNIVGPKVDGTGEEYGSADNRTILFNRVNIAEGIAAQGLNESSLLRGVSIHEIGHNLGGEHSDGTSTMNQVLSRTTNSQIGGSTTTHSYPSTSKEFTRIIFQRRDTRNNDPKSRIIEASIYTKK
ncbi:MAG: RHS repeat-associated core domain-containing protein [Sphingobacterium sp.]|jgi:RHS repeat-associated protein|nr:RHS repeat-associated core domain-containing protein [Sphingobacterium sp.]